jgi:hypothetical protein
MMPTLSKQGINIGAKVVSHSRYMTFPLAEVAVGRAGGGSRHRGS